MNAPGVLLRGGRVLDPRHGLDAVRDVLLQGEVVAKVSDRPLAADGARVVDVSGLWVCPGFVDLHTHLREPGEEGKETILTGTRAAVAGGFTAVVAMPNTRPPNDSTLVTRLIQERAAAAHLARVWPAGAISKGLLGEEMAELGDLAEAGCVCFTDDGRPVMNAGLMRRVLVYARALGRPVMVHEEDLTLSQGGALTEGLQATRLGLLPIPRSAEVAMVARDLVLLAETGGHLHLAHVSCAETVRLVREAKARGLHVSAEAAPHHFTLTDAAAADWNTHAKMNPPLRGPEDVAAVRQGLADGTVDAVATDHAPHGVLDKEVPFAEAANGVVGLETALPLTLALVREGLLTPSRAVELLSAAPASTFRLPGGHLAPGAVADVTVVDPDAAWTVDPAHFQSRSRNTPYAGMRMLGRVVHTWVGGRAVWFEGAPAEGAR
ncbi:MAG TPA: dihydroorotase [Myxococcaceae bacterium]|jgi:dihydroorotase|nr:dihydroorotase [Myxococcaceae bacterium]